MTRWALDEDGNALYPIDEEYPTDEQRWRANAPARFRNVTLADLDEETRATVATWLATVPNLLVTGPVGVGKTHAALAAAREYWLADTRGRDYAFVPCVELLDNLRPNVENRQLGLWDSEPWIDHYVRVDLLVLDDLGGEKASDWTAERLYLIVNRRWLDRKPTIATTNLTPTELKEQLGERTYDRIRDGAIGLRLSGESLRKPA